MPRGFLRSPLKYRRISSGFSYRRLHPTLNKRLPHLAIDYAARRGTAVHAVAHGTVIFAGRKGSYGNLVMIKHAGGVSTRYAHLSKFARGVRKGARVQRDKAIGYVGSTGRATGPHLHYEMYKHGKPVNPLKVKHAPATPITSTDFTRTVHAQMHTLRTGPAPEAIESAPAKSTAVALARP